MNIDLNNMSHKDLMQLQADVEAAIKHAQIRGRREALEAAEKAAAKYGFSLDELSTSGKLKKTKTVSEPKYVNPDNLQQTWTGKGRQPKWYVEAIKGGKQPTDLEI